MAKKPGRTTEREIGEAVLQILAKRPKGEATVAELVKELPKHIKLSSGIRRVRRHAQMKNYGNSRCAI
jgi:hypothetical protein